MDFLHQREVSLFIPSSPQQTLSEHPLCIKHPKHNVGTGNTAVSKADKHLLSWTVLVPESTLHHPNAQRVNKYSRTWLLDKRNDEGGGEGRERSSWLQSPSF